MFKRLDSLSALPPTHRLRFQFMLAVALVSEVAEAISKLLAIPETHISQASLDHVDLLSTCPGIAFQRSILGGLLVEQSFVPLFWRGGAASEDEFPEAWAEEASAGLLLDRTIYSAGKVPRVSFFSRHKSQIGQASGMALLRSEWICQWFSDESWEMLDWGKILFDKGKVSPGWQFWKIRSEGKNSSQYGFVVFPIKQTS